MSDELLVTGGRRAPAWFTPIAAAVVAVAAAASISAVAPSAVIDGHGTRIVPGSQQPHPHSHQPLRGHYVY